MSTFETDEHLHGTFRGDDLAPKAFSRAKDHLESARRNLEATAKASSLDELAWAWSGFLTDAQRVFSKLREATRAGPSKRWSEILQRTRDQDELLRYVHQARHADEHGLERIAQKQNGELNITAGDGPAHIHTITAIPGKGVSIEYRGERPVVTWTPERVVLLPVRNRGVVYPVPTQHLRQRLPDATAISIAERAYQFLAEAVAEAETRFWN